MGYIMVDLSVGGKEIVERKEENGVTARGEF